MFCSNVKKTTNAFAFLTFSTGNIAMLFSSNRVAKNRNPRDGSFQVVLGCILLSLSLINWLWIKQLLQQQTVSSSSQVKQRVIKEKVLTSLPCLSHLHPLDCLSSFFCWRNTRIIMNCHFVSTALQVNLRVALFHFNNTVMISRSDKCVSSALCHSLWF